MKKLKRKLKVKLKRLNIWYEFGFYIHYLFVFLCVFCFLMMIHCNNCFYKIAEKGHVKPGSYLDSHEKILIGVATKGGIVASVNSLFFEIFLVFGF